MTSKDVRDILSLPMDGPGPSTSALAAAAASSSKRRSGGGHGPKRERPEGISRELFALIGDHGVSLAEAQAMVGQEKRGKGAVTAGYKERVGAGRRNVKWRWTPFTPAHHPGGPGGLRLAHWKPENDPAAGEDPFGAFGAPGTGPNVMQYTQQEYDQILADPGWTQAETAYLFSLLKEYDLRFLVVADRYAWVPPGQPTGQEHHPYPIPQAAGTAANSSAAAASGPDPAPGDADDKATGPRERRSTRSIIPTERKGRGSRAPTPSTGQPSEPPAAPALIKMRTMEEIKDRYYTICRRLVRSRPAADEAAKERLETAYKFDIQREISRKHYAASLFHLSRPQIQEEEALYVELQKMQQKQARYATERQELMKTMQGLDSGLFYPDGVHGNKVFGNAAASGIGGARGSDGTIVQGDKMRKRKRGDADDGQMPEVPEPVVHHPIERGKKVDPAADARNNIYRVPQITGPNLGPTRSMHMPAYLRSTKLPLVRPDKPYSMQGRVWALLEELGVNPSRLVMPTRDNVEKVDLLLSAAQNLLEMKKQHDRAEQELRVLQLQKEAAQPAAAAASMQPSGNVAGGDAAIAPSKPAIARSESVLSSTPSELDRSRQAR